MKRAILKHGKLDQYTALGKGGAFYTNAYAFIDAIDLNVKNLPSNCHVEYPSRYLARPVVHDESKTIDWIIPFDAQNPNEQYEIIPWAQASFEERQKAKSELKAFTVALTQYGRAMKRRQDGDSSSALLANYLIGDTKEQELPAIHFPNEDCIYIVDGIPVITFWGFSNEEQVPFRSPLALLKTTPVFSTPLTNDPEFEQPQPLQEPPKEPVYNEPVTNNAPPPPPPQQQQEERRHRCFLPAWLLWLLLLLLLIPLLLWLLWKMFGLFAGLFGPLFGGPSVPSFDANPPAIEQPADQSPPNEPLADPVVEVPSEPSSPEDPMNLDIPLPDVALPNINLEGGSLSGGNISVTPGAGAISGEDPAMEGALDGGAMPDGMGDQGAPMPMGNDQGAPVPPQLDNQGAPMAPEATNQGAPMQEPMVNQAPAPQNAPSGQNAPVIPPDILANNNLTQAQKEAIAAARAAESQSAIDAARAAENKATGQAQNQVVPPEIASPGLSKTNGSVAQKGVNLFDGNWQTKSPLMDSANGRPLQMSYNFKDGKGQVTVTRADGSKCVSPSNANVVKNGIEITNNGRAVCPDNSTYQLPKVNCIDQGNGMVKCTGKVGSQTFPITFHQN